MRRTVTLAACLALALGVAACGNDNSAPPVDCGGVSEACSLDTDCCTGLKCGDSNACEPRGDLLEGDPCTLTAECSAGLYCGPERVCAVAGTASLGGDCGSTADCEHGLICVIEGMGFVCRPAGSGTSGTACVSDSDCQAGLNCLPAPGGARLCGSAPALDGGTVLPSVPYWPGETCEADSGEPRAYFEVPRGDGSDRDFYRLPFPNDVRRTSAGLDLSGHPSPGTVLPIDMIDRYLRASEQDLRGFATNPVVFFRFSKPYDWDSVSGAIKFVDITPGSPTYNQGIYYGWLITVGPTSRYICEDWLAVRTLHGHPLLPGTTYAVTISRAVTIAGDPGATFARSPDFEAVLSGARPASEPLGHAWDAYAPLRQWLADTGGNANELLNAAVFTTQAPEALAPKLREVVQADAVPEITDLTVCAGGVQSPCDDGDVRVCGVEDVDFVEIQGRISLPIFQQGTPPYETPDDGGDVQLGADGKPIIARHEPVCFGLTLPRAQNAPAGGFPLVVYAHGTGGSFRDAVASGLAKAVAKGDAGATPVRAATFAIDLPEHGARRGDSTRDPEHLFFNFLNPRAARDNYAQGAADLMSVARWAVAFDRDAAEWVTPQDVKFDPARVFLFAHSQGAGHAAIAVPYEPLYRAVLLSGNGGDLTQSLLHKQNPIDISAVLPYALLDADGDGHLATGEFHPALAVFQMFFEAADPVNYAWRLQRSPITGDPGRHVFMTYGLGDTYSPEETLQAFAVGARFMQVTPVLANFDLPTHSPPLTANVLIDGTNWTIGLRQYQPPAGVDGHFVAQQSTDGWADVQRFVLQALAGQTPLIGQ
jgi:hypothetical protein